MRYTPLKWLQLWLEAARPATLWAAFVPVMVGCGLAQMQHPISTWVVALIFVTAGLIQVGTNFVNDYKDAQTGADDEDRLGPRRATASGLIDARTMKRASILVLSLAALCGTILILQGGWVIALIGVLSILSAIAYTAGPYPLAYVGLGDVFVIVFFGLVAVFGTEYLLTGTGSTPGLILGFALGAVATGILVVNNLRDMHTDARVGKKTLAVRFGRQFAQYEYAFLLLSAHVCVIYVALRYPPLNNLIWLTVLTVPWSIKCTYAVFSLDGRALNPYLGRTALLELMMGLGITGVSLWST
ncbi:MAG: 1,4-dihydroxy-2-naphthoate polyprenyltransferase [Bradymonadia bacterium]